MGTHNPEPVRIRSSGRAPHRLGTTGIRLKDDSALPASGDPALPEQPDEATLAATIAELPNAKVTELSQVTDLFAEVGLVASKSAARRTVKEGGAYVTNVKVTAEDAMATVDELLHGRWLAQRRGKKNLAAIEVNGA